MIYSKLPKIFYGGDYNPEQWPEEVWQDDMRLMKKAGVNLVSVGIFSWALLQPNENTYDFAWLDRILDRLAANGIAADLATATAAQPAWLSQFSNVLPVDEKGNTVSYGSRQSYCPNSLTYRRYGQQLVQRLAERYRNHPALAMWHINNEYACHTSICYCENCAAAFRVWLRDKYGSVERVNRAWGTNFWSQHYYEWDQIIPPRATATFPNPSQVLDYRRFMSDSLLECYLGEYRILKQMTPDIPITTNLMSNFKPLDYFKWARHMDVVSWDSYPDPEPDFPANWAALNHDLMRSLKNGQPFLLMEQAVNNVNWRPVNTNKRPGVMRLWSYQAVARGADAVLFFQWRQSRKGAEKFHSAMVPHDGDENSRTYREVVEVGRELGELAEITDTRIPAKVAVLFDYENWWAVEYEQRPSSNLLYFDRVHDFYDPLYAANIPVDFVAGDGDFSHYQMVIAPLLYMVKPGVAEKLAAFVKAGGTLVTSYFSGIVDETDSVFPGGYPGPLSEVLGIRVAEFDPLEPHMANRIRVVDPSGQFNEEYACSLWCEVVRPVTAKPWAIFTEDYHAGGPAITCNRFGLGEAWYIGTQPEKPMLAEFVTGLCRKMGIQDPLRTPPGIEVTCRQNESGRYYFVLNHHNRPENVQLPDDREFLDLISGNPVQGSLALNARGVAILKEAQ